MTTRCQNVWGDANWKGIENYRVGFFVNSLSGVSYRLSFCQDLGQYDIAVHSIRALNIPLLIASAIGIKTAIATNQLEKSQAMHFENIGLLQNSNYINQWLTHRAAELGQYFPPGLARIKARNLLGTAQGIQARSEAFQDTFRNSFYFAVIGTIFLILLIIEGRRQKRRSAAASPKT